VEEELEGQLDRHVGAQAEVLEHLSTAIAIFSADTRLVFANTAFVRLWALEPAWIESKPTYGNLLDVLRDHRHLPEVADYRAYRQEELRLFQLLLEPRENLLHLPDERTLRRFVSPHPFGGLLFTYEDVTDTLALERTLTTSLAVHRATLDNLHEGVAVFSGDGRLRLSNPAYARIWRVSAADLADEPHFSDLVERHRAFFGESARWPGIREALLVLFSERLPRGGRLERSDGSILDYASVPLPDGAVLTTWLDVSDTARVERALRDRAEGLAAADRLKSEFMAHVSDELSTPLATILDYSELLTERHFGDLSDRQLGYVQGIASAGRQVREVTGEILDLAAIEAGQLTLSLDFVDLNTLLSGVLQNVRDRLHDKRLTLDFDCPAEVGGMMADERRLRQILHTLISHIVKLTPSDGAIAVTARREEGDIRFTITLSGADLSHERQQRLFDDIVRSALGRDPKGTALGLSLVGRFISLHGGKIEFTRTPAEGAGSITILLPAGRRDGVQPDSPALSGPSANP
jgi:signal transduction histidine kinase